MSPIQEPSLFSFYNLMKLLPKPVWLQILEESIIFLVHMSQCSWENPNKILLRSLYQRFTQESGSRSFLSEAEQGANKVRQGRVSVAIQQT